MGDKTLRGGEGIIVLFSVFAIKKLPVGLETIVVLKVKRFYLYYQCYDALRKNKNFHIPFLSPTTNQVSKPFMRHDDFYSITHDAI